MVEEKLVRDKIPEIIRKSGHHPKVRVAESDELDLLVRKKIVEEAKELLETGNVEEIVDLLEIIDALISLRGLKRNSLEDLRKRKRDERGGFDRGMILDMNDLE